MRLPVKLVHPRATLPSSAHGDEDAAIDLCSVEDGEIGPGEGRAFGTGLALELPSGTVGLIWDRSGLAFKQGITTLGGMIDSGYRGEVKVYLFNTGKTTHTVKTGDRIAQLLVVRHEIIEPEAVDQLTDSARGAAGFASSGT